MLRPVDPMELFADYERLGFRPHGLYLPHDVGLQTDIRKQLDLLGGIQDADERLSKYAILQQQGEELERNGVLGRWTGQQAVVRSRARYRVVGWGRRGGKTFLAAYEAVARAIHRHRQLIWICAPTARTVGRCFDIVVQILKDHGIGVVVSRNTRDEKLIVLDNGSTFEGVSLDSPNIAPGAAVDFAVVDEAAGVTEQAWTRTILPPLTDKNGCALLISSHEGAETFFNSRLDDWEGGGEWENFTGHSWDNFYRYPQGRNTPSILSAEKEMDPIDFLEQFAAIPAAARNLIYPQFKERVHVQSCPYNPEHPVILAIDPSSGANAYVVNVYQDYGDVCYQIDEVHMVGALAEEVAEECKQREWCENVVECVMDSASPTEIRRWQDCGFPASAVPLKPKPEERFPVYRNLLRDPHRYYAVRKAKLEALLAEREITMDEYLFELSPNEVKMLELEIEGMFQNGTMTEDDAEMLRGCSHIFIDSRCIHTIKEMKKYKYMKPVRVDLDMLEKPFKKDDHHMDASGYFAWAYKQFDPSERAAEYSLLATRESAVPGRVPRVTEEAIEARAKGKWEPSMAKMPFRQFANEFFCPQPGKDREMLVTRR